MTVYTDNGYHNREDYLRNLADDYGVDIVTVKMLADLLGEQEDFDGLVIAIADYAETLD